MWSGVAEHQRANVVVLGDEDTAIGVCFSQKCGIAGIGRTLSRVYDIMAVLTKRAHRGGYNIRVCEEPHLFGCDGEAVRVRLLGQTRCVEEAGVDIGGFQRRVGFQNLVPRRPSGEHREHHRRRNAPAADNGLTTHLSGFHRDTGEKILVFLGEGHDGFIARLSAASEHLEPHFIDFR